MLGQLAGLGPDEQPGCEHSRAPVLSPTMEHLEVYCNDIPEQDRLEEGVDPCLPPATLSQSLFSLHNIIRASFYYLITS